MNQTNLQRPEKKPYFPLLASAMMLMGLNNRYRGNSNKGPGAGAPLPGRLLNQRQKRKLKAQTR